MSVEQRKVIDAVGIRRSDGRAVLTISDHLPWRSDNEHLLVLKDIINDYLACVESGEIYDSYPQERGTEIEIQLVHKYPPAGDAVTFLEHAGETIRKAGFHFAARTLQEISHDDAEPSSGPNRC